MAPRSTHDSAVLLCFPGCPAFLHRHFSPQSPPSHPLRLFFNSQQQPSLRDCSTTPKLKRGLCIPLWGMYGYGKDSLILIPFRLPQISCFTLSLKCFSSDSDSCPRVGIGPLLQFPPSKGRSSPTNPPVFPPNSFALLNFTWFYIFFSTCQVLMSTLSRCSACTSVSEGVFLMYPWREMFSTSTYSSAILFCLNLLLNVFSDRIRCLKAG